MVYLDNFIIMKIKRQDLFQAIDKSLSNARSLHEEAVILRNHNRYARSYCLYQFCIEEVGKAMLTCDFLLQDDYSKIDKFLKNFVKHTPKTLRSIQLDYTFLSHTENDVLKKKIIMNAFSQENSLLKLNNYKNYSLYTDWVDGKFQSPEEKITEKDLTNISLFATMRLEMATAYLRIGVTEFENILLAYKTIDKAESQKRMENNLANLFKGDKAALLEIGKILHNKDNLK